MGKGKITGHAFPLTASTWGTRTRLLLPVELGWQQKLSGSTACTKPAQPCTLSSHRTDSTNPHRSSEGCPWESSSCPQQYFGDLKH